MPKCPGQDQRFWKPEDIFEVDCHKCGSSIEFWKDESTIKCPKCHQEMLNPRIDLSCAQWCKYAEKCLGALENKEDVALLCDKLVAGMKRVFGPDRKRIDHAMKVLDFAEQIQLAEGGDPLVVKAAAILHDIGILQAQDKYGPAYEKYHAQEGPPIAKEILSKFEINSKSVEHICQIIVDHHSAGNIDTIEFRIVWDADWLVNIAEILKNAEKKSSVEILDQTFKTNKGREIAAELYSDINHD